MSWLSNYNCTHKIEQFIEIIKKSKKYCLILMTFVLQHIMYIGFMI